jgi:hypothetical protein
MPQPKKHSSVRARRNKATTAATLHVVTAVDYSSWTLADLRTEIEERNAERADDDQLPRTGGKKKLAEVLAADDAPDVPELPDRTGGWSEQTKAWWRDVWSSPMSDEWHDSDIHNVFVCAMLFDDMMTADTASARTKAASEFRQQRASLGLTPYDRRRLEWTIESAAEAKAKGQRRRNGAAGSGGGAKKPAAGGKKDPRAGLSAVS